jgi:hypothetical protein
MILAQYDPSLPPPPPQIPPFMVTLPAIHVTNDSATLVGEVTTRGMYTTTWFEWSAADLVRHSTDEIYNSAISGGYTQLITGLEPGTTYYFRACGGNRAGDACGNSRVFKTGSIRNITVGNSTVPISQPSSTGTVLSSMNASAIAKGLAFLAIILIAVYVALKIFNSGH